MRQQKLTFSPVGMAFLLFLLLGCNKMPDTTLNADINSPVPVKDANISNGDNQKEKGQTELNQNRSLWKENKIENYNFETRQFIGGMYQFVPVQIKVRNNKAISTMPVRKKLQLERIDGYDKINTVEKMFDEIQVGIDRGDELTVTYNKERGFPEKISRSPGKVIGADNELRVEVSKFEIMDSN